MRDSSLDKAFAQNDKCERREKGKESILFAAKRSNSRGIRVYKGVMYNAPTGIKNLLGGVKGR